MKKTLPVAAIKKGTVIDHIPAGQGIRLVKLLQLNSLNHQVTLGLNLPSETLGHKDLIKVEGREVSAHEAEQIAIFAPKATLNIIQDFELKKKFTVTLPEQIEKVLICQNKACITHNEEMNTRFHIKKLPNGVLLTCFYCEKSFSHDTL